MSDASVRGTVNEMRLVVRNQEEQYSIWAADTIVPGGWEVVGSPAPLGECLERIGELWTDMRPASLRADHVGPMAVAPTPPFEPAVGDIAHPGPGFVLGLVYQQAAAAPGRAALIDETGGAIGYGDLTRRSGRLAERLRSLGVVPDDRVAVFLDRSAEVIVAMLAVLEAGGAYSPLDASLPARRLAAILDNLGARVLVTDRALPAGVASSDMPTTRPDAPVDGAEARPADGLQPDHLAYVLHTSGTTGQPKGVAMSHRGLSRLIEWQVADAAPGLTTLQFTATSFDVCFQEVFSTLCTGGTLVLASEELRRDPERLLAFLDARSIERLFVPFVALQQLAKASQRVGVVPRALRHVVTAGERLIVTDAIAALFRQLPGCRLDNHYGPTEAHLVTSATLEGDPGAWPTLPPVGAAISCVTVHVLDNDLVPVACDASGELFVGGSGVARGYLNAPEATAERFLPDPFSSALGARMYRTGDVVRAEGDVLHFLGRTDDQVKVRGFRVEPAEVELCLTDHPHINQAAVGLRAVGHDVDALVAYVVADGPVTAAELTRHVRAVLPSYMVPSRVVTLDALPLSSSGKIDRRRLQEIPLPTVQGDPALAGDSLVDTVRTIWERVLGHDEFEGDDDFFDVGGDSLLATWVVTELSQAVGGPEIELSVLLEDSTPDGIARALKDRALHATGDLPASDVVTLRAGSSSRALVLLHPLGGELLVYRELARMIRSPLRVLGLSWRNDQVGTNLELGDMAAAHLARLRAVFPEGPYLLAGWSFGGVLAFELAQQLVAAGEQVDFLGLIDANPVRDPLTGRLTGMTSHLDVLAKVLGEIEVGGDVGHLLADPSWQQLMGEVPDGMTVAHLCKNLRIACTSMRAAMVYQPAPYDGPIHLFQASDAPAELQESLLAELRRLARRPLELHAVTADHTGILRPPAVEALAGAIDEVLDAV